MFNARGFRRSIAGLLVGLTLAIPAFGLDLSSQIFRHPTPDLDVVSLAVSILQSYMQMSEE
jgi:hypothetical protein